MKAFFPGPLFEDAMETDMDPSVPGLEEKRL
jgi:hypothetical protein